LFRSFRLAERFRVFVAYISGNSYIFAPSNIPFINTRRFELYRRGERTGSLNLWQPPPPGGKVPIPDPPWWRL
jgi:hypothetical protein